MIKPGARVRWIVPVFLAIAVLACASQTEPTATPLPRSTQRPNATSTTAPAQAKATATKASAQSTPKATAVATDASTAPAPFTLSNTPYLHKSGAFTITLPSGWKVDELNNSVFANSPDNVAGVGVSFINVGFPFSDATLTTYIKANEDNWFASFKNYSATANEKEKDGSILVYKTLSLSDGTPETVFSYYWEAGNVAYEEDFWTDTAVYNHYVDPLVSVANSIETNPDAGAKANAYAIGYQFTDMSKLYQFTVPYAWTHDTSTSDTRNIETFTSPDKLSYFENIAVNNASVSAADEAAFATDELKKRYQVSDLKFLSPAKPQKDGSVLLVWRSAQKGIDGETFYEMRGTTFLLLTWVVNTVNVDFFRPVWKALLDTYQVPQP